MPQRARRPCSAPGCPALVTDRFCPAHRRLADRRRGSSTQRGYNGAWEKARLAFLRDHPLCAECLKHNRVTAATCVDHVIPHRGDQRLFWDVNNWQALCTPDHSRKTLAELRS